MTDIDDLSRMLTADRLVMTKLVDGSGVILVSDGLRIFTLNETGMVLVEAIMTGVTDRRRLVARLVSEFDVDNSTAASDIDTFVEELAVFLVAGD